MNVRLTDEERRSVFDATPLYAYEAPSLISAVEDILNARLAAVEAKGRAWSLGQGPGSDPEWYGEQIRGVLGEDPHE